MTRKLTYEFVSVQFIKQGCELISTEYINSNIKLKYKCSCKNISETTWNSFQQGTRCMKCSGNEKLSIKFIQEQFNKQNCKLVETEYINNVTLMKYVCKCDNVSKITWSNFQTGKRCMNCSGTPKYTFTFVYNFFKEQNCELLESEYINNLALMKYKCKCGNKSQIRFSDFQNGGRCMKCSGNEKLTFEYVQIYFKKQNCELLETEYINANTKMKYRCKCGNNSKISFSTFQQRTRCAKCYGNEKHTFENVFKYFKDQNCELLESEYVNTHTKMKYKCECNNESYIQFNHFQNGIRCFECGRDKAIKSSKQFKEYIFDSGEVRKIQGYENIALDELTQIYNEDDIITNRRDMPKVNYHLKDKEHRYYPDIFIKSQNKIIEVKSTWTYKKDLIKNIMKALATRRLGYDFEFWVYHRNKKDFKKIIV